eukprot:TRINITY_DN4220_c0_g1_i2.p1 TRINITY_DN4220_c0_g1~~TRINITY_DN4220_c0_g1_i2.p1  ORF type:complete len:132 (-),score=30.11 TRINITY_DN4220_c0_g1_i2:197-592(-)
MRLHGFCVPVPVPVCLNIHTRQLFTEIRIHKSLTHRHIVRFINFFEDNANVYLLMELCNNKTMMDMMRKRKSLAEAEVRYWIAQIIDALKYMRDQKGLNCMSLFNFPAKRATRILSRVKSARTDGCYACGS